VTVGDLITQHVWRSLQGGGAIRSRGPRLDRPCEYMNCRRPLTEHARPTRGREGR
jgi:hypothetical protein